MILAISGKIGSGKDTFAEYFIEKNPSYVVKKFADKLKFIGSYLTNTEAELWYTQEGKNQYLPDWDMTIGEFQQKLGTDAIRNGLHSEAWAIALFADYDPSQDWIITDCRFPNEVAIVKRFGGYTLRINRDSSDDRNKSKRNLNHISETALDNYSEWDFVLNNNLDLSYIELCALDLTVAIKQKK